MECKRMGNEPVTTSRSGAVKGVDQVTGAFQLERQGIKRSNWSVVDGGRGSLINVTTKAILHFNDQIQEFMGTREL